MILTINLICLPFFPAFNEEGMNGIAGGSSATVTHRQGLAKDQIRANSRSTTFIIVIVVSLLLSVLCVVLVFYLCIRMQHSRQHHQSLKKIASTGTPGLASQITSSPPPPPPPNAGMLSRQDVLSPPYQPNTVGVSMCSNLTSTGACTASPAAYLFTPAHSTG